MRPDERVRPSGDLEGIYGRLAEPTADWAVVLGSLAALYDRAGDEATVEAIRWMVDRHKRPYFSPQSGFVWFDAAAVDLSLGDHESNIPRALFERLGHGVACANHRLYRTMREAEEDLFAAWAAARAAGWAPEHEERVQSTPPPPKEAARLAAPPPEGADFGWLIAVVAILLVVGLAWLTKRWLW